MSLFLLILAMFLGVNRVEAKSYTITSVNIRAQVQQDGSMLVEEKRTFNFSGDYTFAYQYINKKGERIEPYIVKEIKICEAEKCYEQIAPDDVAKVPMTFYIRDEGDRYYVKWFYKASNESKNFILSYLVPNAVTLQRDVAEIYWQAIGRDWEVTEEQVKIDFILPDGVEGSQIQAWAHGPTSGVVSIPDNRTVKLEVSKLPIKTFFEARIILPKESFSGGVMGTKTKAEIVVEEEKFIAETKKEVKFSLFKNAWMGVLFLLMALWQVTKLITKIKLFTKYSQDKKLPEASLSGRWWEPPSEIDPAQVEQLISAREALTPKSLTATILSLVKDRFYKISRSEKKEGFIFKRYKYYLEAIPDHKKEASSIQQLIIELLEEIGGSEGKIPLDEISSWFRMNQSRAQRFFTEIFPKTTLAENIAENYFDKEAAEMKGKYLPWVSILIFMLGLFLIGPLSILGIIPALGVIINIFLAFIILIIGIIMESSIQKRTENGAEEAAKWLGFKKHLEEYSQTVKEPIDSVVIWEKYLVYGTVLGVSIKALSELPINLNSRDQAMIGAYWGGVNGDFGSSLTTIGEAMNSVSSAVSSSYGASGVGSSGGASGGGGGGGGAG